MAKFGVLSIISDLRDVAQSGRVLGWGFAFSKLSLIIKTTKIWLNFTKNTTISHVFRLIPFNETPDKRGQFTLIG